ncbi:serine hydrolase [Microbacterium sp. W4I20]|uniref:serine hydrolase domain-containing protein n=1 Tax=Microbacterium sp. W4I20 TaxID=3042262 RepID=UPI002788A726|nr:serine hydrolase domain-containing protein [Microbacterium sp. W4I20]MDQ0727364.1 D-alanyl-D-alanine carboxypeptidase [Microbacterium sp. W4I20]
MNDITTPPTPPTRRRRARAVIAIAAAAVLVGGALTAGALFRAADRPAASAETASSTALETRMQSLVDAGYPAVLAAVTSPDGDVENVVAGEGNIETGEAPPIDGEVRIASNTKMFVSTVVLQLVDEGLVDLEAPIDTYLPGLIRGDGIDGTAITVHQLLQQTTGLPEYADQIAADAFGAQEKYISPRDMLDIALSRPAGFAPGEKWEYSNTNYLVLGLLIEAVTDRAIAEQIDERIVRPLGLEHTYFPAPGERELRGEHPIGYHADVPGELRDISAMDTSFAWSAGAMVSTPSELNTFMAALLNGELLSDASLGTMQTTVPAGDELWPEGAYGLGLQRYPLSCGGVAWGHGGDIPGTQTRNAVGPDGTAVTVAVTSLPWAVVSKDDDEVLLEQYRIVVEALDETLCDR